MRFEKDKYYHVTFYSEYFYKNCVDYRGLSAKSTGLVFTNNLSTYNLFIDINHLNKSGIFKCEFDGLLGIYENGNVNTYYADNLFNYAFVQLLCGMPNGIGWLTNSNSNDIIKDFPKTIDLHKCHCELNLLLRDGCKCGGV